MAGGSSSDNLSGLVFNALELEVEGAVCAPLVWPQNLHHDHIPASLAK